MPIYVYRDPKTGETIEAVKPVGQRDEAPPGFVRVTVPERVGVLSGALDPSTPEGAYSTQLRKMEDKLPAREIARQAGFSVEHLKKTWLT